MNQPVIIDMFYTICSYRSIIFILFATFASAKSYLIYIIYTNSRQASNIISLRLLLLPVIYYLIGELAVICSLFCNNIILSTLIRIACNIQPIQFYTQILFVHSLVQQKYVVQEKDKKILYGFFIIIFFPLILLFVDSTKTNLISFLFFDVLCKAGIVKHALINLFGYLFLIKALYRSWIIAISSSQIPHILRMHLKIFFYTYFYNCHSGMFSNFW